MLQVVTNLHRSFSSKHQLQMLGFLHKWYSRSLLGEGGESTDQCTNVLQAYNDAGCCPSCSPIPPGWAGKTCTAVFRLSFGGIETYVYDGFQFSQDGTTYTERFTTDTNGTRLALAVTDAVASSQFDSFGYLCFDNYRIQRMYDDSSLIWGVLQNSSNPDAFCGYGSQNNGMRFSDNFSQATYISAPDIGLLCEAWWGCTLVNGLIWVKAPPAYAVDDSGNITSPTLTCVTTPSAPPSPPPLFSPSPFPPPPPPPQPFPYNTFFPYAQLPSPPPFPPPQ